MKAIPRFAWLVALLSCTGAIDDASLDPDNPAPDQGAMLPGGPGPIKTVSAPADAQLAAGIGIRRLTADEYNNTLRDLLDDAKAASQLILPNDSGSAAAKKVGSPFDNDATTQAPSSALVEGVELLAHDASAKLLAEEPRRDRIVGCKPAEAGCFARFVARFGRRALRRPLIADEIARYQALEKIAKDENNFYAAIDAVVRVMLQDMEFLYRVEIGTPVTGKPGLFRLGPWELASRLSYFLWGSMPDDRLFARAADGKLATAADVRAAAAEMLADAKGQDRVKRFHALWFGYQNLLLARTPSLTPAMRTESDALVSRVIFEQQRPWQDLFRSTETFIANPLAKHYGLTPPGNNNPVWMPYGTASRRGLLSHGAFLALAGTEDERLMTIRRGKMIRELLFCQTLPEKPANASSSAVPKSPCKEDVLEAHRQGSCAACHLAMDPVGFGLDAYDSEGKLRASVSVKDAKGQSVTCPIGGKGDLDGTAFRGPVALEDLMLASGGLNACAATQLFRFAMGKSALDDTDQSFIGALVKPRGGADFRFDELLLDFVSSNAFAHRRVLAEP